jgi:hypothetical protein
MILNIWLFVVSINKILPCITRRKILVNFLRTKTLLCVDCVFTDGTYKNHHIVKADSVESELNKEILDYR